MSIDRFDRNIRLFAREGQERVRSASIAVVGVGGIGTHVVQQLSLLGVGGLALIDPQEMDASNRNRYIGARYDDPIVIVGAAEMYEARCRRHHVVPTS